MDLLDGKKVSKEQLEQLKNKIALLTRSPRLVVFLIGDDPASHIYVKRKKKVAQEIGVDCDVQLLKAEIAEEELKKTIAACSNDKSVDAIFIQCPLPGTLNLHHLIEAIDPKKDADGLHPLNLGKLFSGIPQLVPCTPLGIQMVLQSHSINLEGKHVVIIGRSLLVGKPLAALLWQKSAKANATVTVAHSRTKNLERLCQQADILVAAMGRPRFVRAEMVKRGAVVIDVGISREHGALVGDVDFDRVAPLCQWITPVPGGVGPMTIAMLFSNVLTCFYFNNHVA